MGKPDPRSGPAGTSRVSRRQFLELSGAGTTLGAAVGAVLFQESQAFAQRRWDREVDVLVAGSGAAGSVAALFAHEDGASVLVIEKAPSFGGTTRKSAGVFWIPNNFRMREQGIADAREDCLRFMARAAYPALYNAGDMRFGLHANEYDLLVAFYDNAADTVDRLRAMDALESGTWIPVQSDTGQPGLAPDYYAQFPENKASRGRAMVPSADGKTLGGTLLVAQLKRAIESRRIPVLLQHRAARLVLNSRGAIVGLEVTAEDGRTVTIRTRKAVIFATGGFTANAELCGTYLRGPIFGGCAVPTNEGDFIRIGTAVGAQLANMNNAWWVPCILEQALQSRSTPSSAFSIPGDSMIVVNAMGRRVLNEKHGYHERGQAHFGWDPYHGRYLNSVLFMIYDQRCRERYRDTGALIPGGSATHLLSGNTLEELAQVIDRRLQEVADRTGNVRLDAAFVQNLRETIGRFNQFAEAGADRDFHRGEVPVETLYAQPRRPDNDKPNFMMYPMSMTGPYYAVLLGGGTLDTNGGPRINSRAQVLDVDHKPIPGLYGAGNCVGSPMGAGYHAAGATIGPAMTFGAIAARNAVKEPLQQEA